MPVKIGCCGFPVAKKQYTSHFQIVEIQQTFYHPPGLSTIEKWRNEVPSDFEFTIKAWQLITHPPSSPTYRRTNLHIDNLTKDKYGRFLCTQEVINAWQITKQIADTLNTKVIVFQSPASFTATPENITNIKKFFSTIQHDNYIFVWESRGKWDDKVLAELCRKLDLIDGVDPFTRLPTTKRYHYFRLHGKKGYKYKYTNEDLKFLVNLCKKLKNCYVMFNNMYMFDDAIRFKKMMRE